MHKIVVLGSTGMAGHVVSQYLAEQGHDVYRASRSENNSEKSASIDVCDIPSLERWLDKIKPSYVVNCIGLLQKTCDERTDLAVMVNSYLPKYLENKYKNSDTRIIHLSTDCVFSGERGGYVENDLQDGSTMYDRSKALGEINNHKDLTFRMSIIGPDIDSNGTGLFNWFMKQSGMTNGYSKAIWNGITTIELARGINAAITSGLTGLYHLVTPEPIDKYNLLKLFNTVFKRNCEIVSVNTVVLDKSLRNSRNDFDFKVKHYDEQIAEMHSWVKSHSNLYPHYF